MSEQNDKKPVDREQLEKEYETLGIRDRFIFSKVMTDKNLCIQVLRCLTGNDIEDIGDITAVRCQRHLRKLLSMQDTIRNGGLNI